MKTIYLDSEFTCHASDTGSLQALETEVFDGKCDKYIEGYRFVPAGQIWTRDDGTRFSGLMLSPHKDYDILAAYQEQYEETLAQMQTLETENADMKSALDAIYLGVLE